jgi:hypothetical protein
MMKLDKEAFSIQRFEEAANHQGHCRNLSEENGLRWIRIILR